MPKYKTNSLLRRLEYKRLSEITLEGKILDLGGSKHSGYHQLLRGNHSIEVANLSDETDPDLKFDIEKKFPIEDGAYDGIICLNVLEHIFNYQNAVEESFRVLKSGGVMIGSTPFLFRVHRAPEDYFRYTKSALQKIFEKEGFKVLKICELGTGSFSASYHLRSGIYRAFFVEKISMKSSTFLDKLLRIIKKENSLSEKYMPLGYFFVVKK